MEPKNWPKAFQYSCVSIYRDAHEIFFHEFLRENKESFSDKKGTIAVHKALEIQKITPDFVYNGPLPHPLAGQDVFEGHAQHGVFAKENISKKTFLGEYVGEIFLTQKATENFVSYQKGVYCWHVLLNDNYIHIYSGKIANELTFVNDYHGLSQSPNVQGKWLAFEGFYHFGYETIRDIEMGEEILIDYRLDYKKLSQKRSS